MKLVEIAKKPTLQRLELADEETVQKYGEPLEFWCYDRQPLDAFLKFANRTNDPSVMAEILREMILDEAGNPIMANGLILPSDLMIKVANKLVEHLGNL